MIKLPQVWAAIVAIRQYLIAKFGSIAAKEYKTLISVNSATQSASDVGYQVELYGLTVHNPNDVDAFIKFFEYDTIANSGTYPALNEVVPIKTFLVKAGDMFTLYCDSPIWETTYALWVGASAKADPTDITPLAKDLLLDANLRTKAPFN